MNRDTMIQALESHSEEWDVCIIGGGATGLGTAVDAAHRGFKTLLVEQHDFAKGTSSRSTKLIHGGVRYLQQGNIKLVIEALRERGLLRKNAPHLVKDQSFVIPNYKWWEGAFYGFGLKVYDWMAGRLGLGPSQILSKEETLQLAPTLDEQGLRGGVLYYDGQFDDARLAINLARTAADHGGVLINYMQVTALQKTGDRVTGVTLQDALTGKAHSVKAKTVINATGIFTDSILQMDDKDAMPIIALSQGIHLVVDKNFLPGKAAIMIPHTDDGRVLFAVPWHNKTLVGTTDTPVKQASLEPRAEKEEIAFILHQIGKYLQNNPEMKDVKSIFAGLRPLVKGNAQRTAALPRDHLIQVSDSSLITITGGKWTTYRRMAEDVVNIAITVGALPKKISKTSDLPIHGWKKDIDYTDAMYFYGSDAEHIRQLASEGAGMDEKIHVSLPYRKAEIIWAVKNEMSMTVEDALARRTRALLLDARAAIEAAPVVAALMAKAMHKEAAWEREQIASFTEMATQYLPDSYNVITP